MLGNTSAEPLRRVPVPTQSKAPASRKHSKNSRPASQVWSAGACALATALDDACSGTRLPSRSDEFPFRRGPKLRQAGSTPKHSRLASQVWSAGACALATVLDDVGSGTRWPGRSDEFPFQRNPKLRQVGSTPKHSRPASQVWSAGACALATALDDVGSGTRWPSRSDEFPFRRDPKLRQAGSTPKHSRPATQVWSAGACALATALDDACSGTRLPSRSDEFPLRRDPKLRQVGSTHQLVNLVVNPEFAPQLGQARKVLGKWTKRKRRYTGEGSEPEPLRPCASGREWQGDLGRQSHWWTESSKGSPRCCCGSTPARFQETASARNRVRFGQRHPSTVFLSPIEARAARMATYAERATIGPPTGRPSDILFRRLRLCFVRGCRTGDGGCLGSPARTCSRQ